MPDLFFTLMSWIASIRKLFLDLGKSLAGYGYLSLTMFTALLLFFALDFIDGYLHGHFDFVDLIIDEPTAFMCLLAVPIPLFGIVYKLKYPAVPPENSSA
ncbi:hypothetical protein [Geothrix terrae]|uniref:hypothetical protein n=1 Tax=Geothrix terrae TaxID=2922720 RepID=UPI001FAB63D8|nr:hypothetical protein [Geothrix terrae]